MVNSIIFCFFFPFFSLILSNSFYLSLSSLCSNFFVHFNRIANNIAGHAKRGIAVGLVLMSANIGGVIASQIYREKDFPHYTFGNSIALGCLVVATCIAVLQDFIYK